MSIVPMEMESQEDRHRDRSWPYRGARHGHRAGARRTWRCNPAVDRVTVVERDPHVIALIEALGIFAQLPPEAREKIRRGAGRCARPGGPMGASTACRRISGQNSSSRRNGTISDRHPGQYRRRNRSISGDRRWSCGALPAGRGARCRSGWTTRLDRGRRVLPLLAPDRLDYADIAAAPRWWTPKRAG